MVLEGSLSDQGARAKQDREMPSMQDVAAAAPAWDSIAIGARAPLPVAFLVAKAFTGREKGMWKWRVLAVTLRDRRTSVTYVAFILTPIIVSAVMQLSTTRPTLPSLHSFYIQEQRHNSVLTHYYLLISGTLTV